MNKKFLISKISQIIIKSVKNNLIKGIKIIFKIIKWFKNIVIK